MQRAHFVQYFRAVGELTRISSLEPDGNVTSVETPVPMLSLLRVYYSIKAELNQAFSIVLLSFLTNYCL